MRHIRYRAAHLAFSVFCVILGFAWPSAAQTVQVRPRATAPQQVQIPSRIGVDIRDVGQADVDREKLPGQAGAYVTDVWTGGPAEKAGVRRADVIVDFDGERVRSAAGLERLIRETPGGRTVKVGVMRGGKRMELAVTPEADVNAAPAAPFRFEFPSPEFREGPLQPPSRPRILPDPPPNNWYYYFPPSPRAPRVPVSPRLGISVQELTPQLADYFRTKEGVLVAAVEEGSPASRAGLKAGDIVTSIDGQAVSHTDDVARALRDRRAGDQVTLGIVRDRRPETIKVTLSEDRRGI
jgi:serine protease Do